VACLSATSISECSLDELLLRELLVKCCLEGCSWMSRHGREACPRRASQRVGVGIHRRKVDSADLADEPLEEDAVRDPYRLTVSSSRLAYTSFPLTHPCSLETSRQSSQQHVNARRLLLPTTLFGRLLLDLVRERDADDTCGAAMRLGERHPRIAKVTSER